MATATLTKAELPGTLGPIWIDVRTSSPHESAPAVIVIPGFKGFKDWGMFPPLGERLARAGFTSIIINVSGSGVDDSGQFAFPERFGHNTFSAELTDLDTVVTALQAGKLGVAPPSSIGVIGHSRGGGIAVLAARAGSPFQAVVTWAAIATVERWDPSTRQSWRARGRLDVVNARTGQVLPMYHEVLDETEPPLAPRVDIAAASAEVRIPWLIIHGDADEAVPWTEAETLARRAPAAELLRIAGAGHTFGAAHPFAGPTPALQQVFDATAGFLARHLH